MTVGEWEIRVTNELLAWVNTMTNFPEWRDVRGDIVAGVGGEEAIAEARRRNQAYIDGHRLAERRKALGLTQAEVAERMSVTKSRVSQIERGEVSTIEAVARYVQAIGGQIQISAVFGDELYILRGTVTEAA
jgi:DNA-binding XRE family transcriptional regulator